MALVWKGGEHGALSNLECDSFPPGAGGGGRAERVRAGGLGPPHTPAARSFIYGGYQRPRPAIKFMKRGGGVSGRRAGPRSFLTLIRISQGFASRS